MTTQELAHGQVLVRRAGRLGHITLNRPAAINSLNLAMVRAIAATLQAWASDPEVSVVALTGAGDRGFCAGGDIVAMTSGEEGALASAALFLTIEYRLNASIASYPKPIVAIMDGIVLGGGIGLSGHASHRVVTERSQVGMPETGIGFLPDVGGTWLLTRSPGHLGTHLALTGTIVPGEDGIAAGLADVMIGSASIPGLLDALEAGDADSALSRFVTDPAPSALAEASTWIDASYSAHTVREILDRLRASDIAEAREAASTIESRSPSAVLTTFEALTRAANLATLEEALNQEFRAELHLAIAPDFAEGVRAQLIDKDRRPRWSPATLGDVDPVVVEASFEPVQGHPDPLEIPVVAR